MMHVKTYTSKQREKRPAGSGPLYVTGHRAVTGTHGFFLSPPVPYFPCLQPEPQRVA